MNEEREFPMHSTSRREGYAPLIWSTVEMWRKRIESNHGQTLERLAERGGLAVCELYCAAHDLSCIPLPDKKLVDEWMKSTPPKSIPVAAARRYGRQYAQTQVIVLSFGPDGRTHVVTWGKTEQDCKEAAAGGQRLVDYLELS